MVKRSRLPKSKRTQRSSRLRWNLINAMVSSEKEFAEERWGKPLHKFSLRELKQEWQDIIATYPEEDWSDIELTLKQIK